MLGARSQMSVSNTTSCIKANVPYQPGYTEIKNLNLAAPHCAVFGVEGRQNLYFANSAPGFARLQVWPVRPCLQARTQDTGRYPLTMSGRNMFLLNMISGRKITTGYTFILSFFLRTVLPDIPSRAAIPNPVKFIQNCLFVFVLL